MGGQQAGAAMEHPRWNARPIAAGFVQAAVLVIPLVASALAGLGVARVVHRPDGWMFVPWVAAVIGVSVVASFLADRGARRLLPLAALLRLSLVFPDRTPSRFAIALRAGTTRRLAERVDRARTAGVEAEPARAAGTILSLVAALAAHEPRTRGHSERVRAFTDLLGEELGLSPADRDRLRWAALVHDIGKLEVDAGVLTKPGRLDDDEFAAVRRHPIDGARIAAPLLDWLGEWASAIEHHHERWDGRGYPYGLAGTGISLGGRIVAVADAFEVMTGGRTYQSAVDFRDAREELARCAGSQFDPEVVRAFLRISLPRMRWALGALSGLGQVPVVLHHLPKLGVGARVAQSAGAVAVSAGVVLGGIPVVAEPVPASPSPPPAVVSAMPPARAVQTPRAETSAAMAAEATSTTVSFTVSDAAGDAEDPDTREQASSDEIARGGDGSFASATPESGSTPTTTTTARPAPTATPSTTSTTAPASTTTTTTAPTSTTTPTAPPDDGGGLGVCVLVICL